MCQIAKIESPIGSPLPALYQGYVCISSQTLALAKLISSFMWDVHHQASQQLAAWRGRIHAGCRAVGTSVISYCILESQLFSEAQIAAAEREAEGYFASAKEAFGYERQTLDCDAGVLLEGIRLQQHGKVSNKNKKVLIYFLGNASLWGKEHKLLADICRHDACDVLCFNYRGTGRSSGFAASAHDLIGDGLQIVQSLTSKNLLPKNITLFGGASSFGQRIGRQVAQILTDEGTVVQSTNTTATKSIPDSIRESFPCFAEQIASLVEQYGWSLPGT